MTGALRLLFVDDDVDIRTIVTVALGLDPAISLTVFGATNEALAALETGPPFDAAVLDVSMSVMGPVMDGPTMDGPALLAALHAIVPGLPVIFMTARSRDHELAALRAAGAVGVIVKPFEPLTLVAQVRALLA